MGFQINDDERSTLYGLPHIQQMIYYNGIRPYMDYRTGIVGEKRGISHQSLAEEIYVAPHSGVKPQKFSRDQIRRAVEGLQRAGVIKIQSVGRMLIIHCKLATYNFNIQNKAAILPPDEVACSSKQKSTDNTGDYRACDLQAAQAKVKQPAIPLFTDLNINNNATRKSKVPLDFQPSSSVIENAKAYKRQLNLSQEELSRFILYHRANGTESFDWDATYLYWLITTERFQQGGKKDGGYIKPARTKPMSARERVLNANRQVIEDHAIQQARDNHRERYRSVVDSNGGDVRQPICESIRGEG